MNIKKFRNNKIDMQLLIKSMRGLLSMIESIDTKTISFIQYEINNLDYINYCIIDGSIDRWQSDYKKDTLNSINKIENICNDVLSYYLKSPDLSIVDRAEKLNETWLQCPKCTDAWEAPLGGAVVICPTCNAFLHDPRYQEPA